VYAVLLSSSANSCFLNRAVLFEHDLMTSALLTLTAQVIALCCCTTLLLLLRTATGANATVVDSYVWEGATVEDGATVTGAVLSRGSVVKAGAVVPTGCVLGHCVVVGKGVKLPPFTRLTCMKVQTALAIAMTLIAICLCSSSIKLCSGTARCQ
jgi:UDP-3-O-[3-hydroxymyristoyl] glucosamine N-acyltransferase